MSSSIVTFEHVSYEYADRTQALKKISITIEQGKKYAVIGNNGAGKSTLFLLLNGILKPSTGTVMFKEKKLSYTRKEIRLLREQIGLVFQNPESQLFCSSVYDDIRFGPKNLGMTEPALTSAVDKAMELTETAAFQNKPPHFLSLGQKKRVAIAGVIAMNPEIIILDEPTAGLDPYYSDKMMKLFNQLHQMQRTIILSTHDVDLAYEWADEIILLHDGQVLAQGPPSAIFQDEDMLKLSHLHKPFVMQVYEKLMISKLLAKEDYPQSKRQLLEWIEKS